MHGLENDAAGGAEALRASGEHHDAAPTDYLRGAARAISGAARDERLGALFLSCMTDTLARTITRRPDGTVFVITGDIPAMWLRDSSAQLRPFLPFLPQSGELRDIVAGILATQFASITHDPYANAFNPGPTGAAYDPDDASDDPWLWERKYEVDSLALPVQVLHRYWEVTGDRRVFTADVHNALALIVATWRTEQNHEALSDYRFERLGTVESETLPRGGLGSPVAETGMTWGGFRPSDDACRYGYNIPAQLCAARSLRNISDIARTIYGDAELATTADVLRDEIMAGVELHGIVEVAGLGRIYAYEVDGLGNSALMDDANMPSLLSLPLVSDVDHDDPVYLATRAFVLSSRNPYFSSGSYAEGVGSPHTPHGYVWPIALAVQGLTTADQAEKRRLLTVLQETDGGTGWMHEGFDPNDPHQFTRPWFSWANSMFCELALDYAGLLPDAIR